MANLAQVLRQIETIRRAGTNHFFLVTGNCYDAFPDPDDPDSAELRPLADLIAARYRQHLPLYLDLADGLSCPDRERAEAIHKQIEKGERAACRSDACSEADQAIAQAKSQIRSQQVSQEGRLTQTWDQGLGYLRQLLPMTDQPILVLIPRLDSLVPIAAHGTDPLTRWAVDCLLKLATDQSLAKIGHLFVAISRQAKGVDQNLLNPDSRVAQLRLDLPDAKERRETVRRLVAGDELCRKIEEVKRQRQELVSEQLTAAQGELARLESRLTDLRNKQTTVQENWKQVQRDRKQRLKKDVQQAHARVKQAQENRPEDLRPAIREMESRCRPWPTTLSGTNWSRLRVGDRLYVPHPDSDQPPRWLQVLEVEGEPGSKGYGLRLSWPNQADHGPMTENQEPGGNPLIYRWRKGDLRASFSDNQDDHVISVPKSNSPVDQPWIVTEEERERFQEGINAFRELESLRQLAQADRQQALAKAQTDLEQAEQRLKEFNQEEDRGPEQELTEIVKEIERLESDSSVQRTLVDDLDKGDIASLPVGPARRQLEELDRQQETLRQGRFQKPAISLDEIVRLASGLRCQQLRDLLAMAEATEHPLDSQDVCRLKLHLLNEAYGHLFEIVQPKYGFGGIGGLDHLKREFSRVVKAIQRGNHAAVPMGILLNGPPGTGKTAIAEALALECGFAFIQLRNLRSMWVGETERQTEEVIDAVRGLAPVIVLRDEVDEEDSGRDTYQGDSGVSARTRRAWMRFLSDPKIRGQVLVISCSNRPDRLDAALKRSGRTDWRIPVLMPDQTGREAIFQVMFGPHRYDLPHSIGDFSEFSELCEGLSGADIERITTDSYRLAEAHDKKRVDEAVLREAVADFIPSADGVDIERMTDLAILQASHYSFLTPEDRQRRERLVSEQRGRNGHRPAATPDSLPPEVQSELVQAARTAVASALATAGGKRGRSGS